MSQGTASALKRLLLACLRFRISTLLLLTAIVAILLSWRHDRQRLLAEIDRLTNPGPHWGVDEAVGPPNTTGYGDLHTAWASNGPDDQQEWLLLEFATEIVPAEVHIYETYNPGAVFKIARVDMLSREETLWEGADPTSRQAQGGVSKIPIRTAKGVRWLKVYVDSPAVPGWNEIDAVGIIDQTGATWWAKKATASTSFGPNRPLQTVW